MNKIKLIILMVLFLNACQKPAISTKILPKRLVEPSAFASIQPPPVMPASVLPTPSTEMPSPFSPPSLTPTPSLESTPSPPNISIARFSQDIQTIFTKHCVTCHSPPSNRPLPGNMPLTEGLAYVQLVGIKSIQDANWTRVVPFKPEDSLLYLKVRDTNPPVGTRMPLARAPLTETEIEQIRQWIEAGAADN